MLVVATCILLFHSLKTIPHFAKNTLGALHMIYFRIIKIGKVYNQIIYFQQLKDSELFNMILFRKGGKWDYVNPFKPSFCGTLTNSAKPDQTPQNAASDQVLHCLLTEDSLKT